MIANISDETRNEFVSDLQKKLKEAIEAKDDYEVKLNLINSKINDYHELMTLLGASFIDLENNDELIISDDNGKTEMSSSSGRATWSEKVVKILDNPSKYGIVGLYKGINDIFNAVAKEFSESTDKENAEKIKRTLAPTVSRLINDGLIVKVKKVGTKNEFYQVSPKWYTEVDGTKKPLPEYEEILRDYEIVLEE